VTFRPQAARSDLAGTTVASTSPTVCGLGYHRRVAEESAQPLSEQLEEIRTQLAWVRDYL